MDQMFEPDVCFILQPKVFVYKCVGDCTDPADDCHWSQDVVWTLKYIFLTGCEDTVEPYDECTSSDECQTMGVRYEYVWEQTCRCY
jgi:hypothetical protein